jgi:hypothetical protein
MSKGVAFLIGIGLVTMFGLLETFFPGRNPHMVTIIQTIATTTGAYISLQILNNGVRGKYFNAELYGAENPPQAGQTAGGGNEK